ncbi:MAG: hypothetical protein GY838_13090 [bacterium]|nr:hypothetical protein [bacterium]
MALRFAPRRQGKTRHRLMTAVATEMQRLVLEGLSFEQHLKSIDELTRMNNSELADLYERLRAKTKGTT